MIYFFYATGHSPQFSSLQFQCGFIGLDTYNFHLGTFLMTLNTFCSFLFFIFSIPTIFSNFKIHKTNTSWLVWNGFEIKRMSQVCLLVYGILGIWSFGTMMNGFVNRRHLMVWRVFAPKYIFDVFVLLISEVMILVICGLVWMYQNPKEEL